MWLLSVYFTDIENCTKANQYDNFTNWAVRMKVNIFMQKTNSIGNAKQFEALSANRIRP